MGRILDYRCMEGISIVCIILNYYLLEISQTHKALYSKFGHKFYEEGLVSKHLNKQFLVNTFH